MDTAARRRQRRLIPISLLQFAGGGAFTPFVFLYLSRDQGLTYPEIGQIFVFASLASSVVPILFGVIADRYVPVNRLLMWVHVASALSVGLLSVASGRVPVSLLTVIWFTLWNASNSLYNAVCFHVLDVPREEFGCVRGWGSLGWILPLVPIWYWHDYRDSESLGFVLLIGVVIHILTVFVCARLPHVSPGGTSRSGSKDDEQASLPFLEAMRILLRRPSFWLLLVSACCVYWALNVMFFYSPVLFKERFQLDQRWIGPLFNAGVPMEIVFFLVLHRVIRRVGYLGALVLGSLCLLLRQVFLAYSDSLWVIVVSSVLPALSVPLFLSSMSLTIDAIADRHVRASAQAILAVCSAGLASAACHWFSGDIVGNDGEGLTRVFVVGALMAAVPLITIPAVQLVEGRRLGFFAPPRDGPDDETGS